MLKTRILSALIGIVILFVSVLGPVYFLKTAVFALTLLLLYEFFNALKISSLGFKLIGYVISIPFLFFYDIPQVFYLSLYLLLLASFAIVILNYERTSVKDVFITLMASIFISFMMSHILKVRELEYGNLLIWLIFLGAWLTDTFAYFVGVKFGKHKLTPISPKKSIEGSIGGVVGATVSVIIFGYIMVAKYGVPYPMYIYVAIGIIGSIIAQMGDLSASLIKRSTNIKDFGTIMPGHGGAIDRFDSILFIAPFIYYYLYFFSALF